MKLSALLTSAGINTALSVVLFSLYSILRKQPGNFSVYFGRKLAEEQKSQGDDYINFERFVPSPSWIVKAWSYTEEDILSISGLDAVVFLRMLVFSIRIFSFAAVICILLVLPVNYYGQDEPHRQIPSENLDVFTISNINKGSRWLAIHCLVLYIISFAACALLYIEYRSIAKMRLAHIAGSPNNFSYFTILVRSIPKSTEESLSDSVKNYFMKFHPSSYLSHQMVYRTGKVQKLMNNAETVYNKFAHADQKCNSCDKIYGLCACISGSFQLHCGKVEVGVKNPNLQCTSSSIEKKECASAIVFFKNRYAAVAASQVLHSSNPMLWITELAPEPGDVYWSNLWIPYKQLWMRRIATLMISIVFMFLFIVPVTFVQGLSQLDQLQQMFPFLREMLKTTFVTQVVTGYLPSVILMLFLYTVSPTMILLTSLEGPISYSARKKSACYKVLYFTIWNVFFANVLSGSIISQINVISSPKDIPNQLAKAVPRQATFFITYVLTSGWASLSSEVVQLFPLVFNFIKRHIFRKKINVDSIPSFPYHTEIPRVLLFGLLGFICSILAPLILPFLVVYFSIGFIVYRNQIVNVYRSKYETGGQFWPIVHNTVIFSLVLAQIIALGVFGIKDLPVASGFTIPLVILTILFNEYCRHRFHPIFKDISPEVVIEMDNEDDRSGRVESIHVALQVAYSQFPQDKSKLPKNGIDHQASMVTSKEWNDL